MTAKNAEILGLEALAWLAGDENALKIFLAASGVDGAALREAAAESDTIAAVFDFLLANEDLLLAFCETASIPPASLQLARRRLDGGG